MDLHGNTFHGATVECNFSFNDVIENEKDELYDRMFNVYFKDEPVIRDILKDEDKWEGFFSTESEFSAKIQTSFSKCSPKRKLSKTRPYCCPMKNGTDVWTDENSELLEDDDPKELFEDHFYRQLTHRYAGTLYGKTTVRPEKIVRQIALFVATYYVTHYIKSQETSLSPEHKLRLANAMLKVEIRSLGKDLERRDDLCDDLLNEIFRHEKKIDTKSEENDKLILKNKSRLGKINILKEELKKMADPPKGSSAGSKASTPGKASGKTPKGEKSQGKKKAEKEKQHTCPESTESSDNEDN